MSVTKKGSMRHIIGNINKILINDEELLRTLYYPPMDENNPDPLDEELENIKDKEDYWDIVTDRIMLAEKDSDLINKAICRVYIFAGRRRPVFNSYLLATQEVVISIYTHESYEEDQRNSGISDRVCELLSLEDVVGVLGKLDYFGGNPRQSPSGYLRYDHTFEFHTMKK
jgi:hypothetical protein